ncbi:MAG: hypothetical protein JSS30_00060 [Verrucomicrobia bacterium]|nr:hypothetical protein [Verrucomicrobiota bacterium]
MNRYYLLLALPLTASAPIFIIDQNAFTYSQIDVQEGLYLDLFANIASQDKLDFHTEGLSLAVARCFGNCWTFGLAAFYSRNHYHEHRLHDRGRIVSVALTPYARLALCPFFAEAELIYAYSRIRNKETNFHTDLLMPHLEVGLEFCHFVPFVSFDWASNWHHHYSSMLRSQAGIRFPYSFGNLITTATFGYVNKAPFDLCRYSTQNLGTWGLSLRYENECCAFAMIKYDGEAGSGYFSNLIQLEFGIPF